ncbi:MAG: response regulator, partial [Polaromonas sp.]|nr:response regulator [Polaromonas sp.]
CQVKSFMSNIDATAIRRIFREMPGLFLVLAPEAGFRIVAASNDYLAATHTDTGIFGQPLFKVFPDNPADAQASGASNLRASLERVLATRAPDRMAHQRYDVRTPGISQDFEERHWAPSNAPVLTDDGTIEYIIHSVQEVIVKTSRDAVEILESITEGFFTLDRQWRFDYVNAEAHRILDRQPGTLFGKVVWEEFPDLEETDFGESYRKAMFDREKGSFTGYYPLHDRWYDVTTFPAHEGISVYFRNVTATRLMETERRNLIAESEKQTRIYETALNSTPDFVYVFDLEHRAIYANEALLKVWDQGDVRGKTWMDLGYEQWHADMHDAEIDTVIATRAPIRGEIPFTGTNGRRVYDYIFAPVLDSAGEVVAIAGTTRDVTDRHMAEQAIADQAERLAALDRTKDEFLATLSHELRNPLAPLRNSIALLRRSRTTDRSSSKVYEVMERQVNHIVRLVDDLLEVSRISRGTLSLRKEPVELATVVRNALETCDAHIRAAGHALVLDLPKEPLWLEGDPVRLAQILANLLDNAAKYADDGGSIVVRSSRDGNMAAVSVTDNGFGIAPDKLPRMFEMFSRGERESQRSPGGLGIGLALARKLAEMHGGSLEAVSQGVGQGSEFSIRLPVSEPAEMKDGSVAAAEAPDISRCRVLVVDDNHDVGDTLGEVLELLGAQVRVVRSGLEALDSFASSAPTVVLLDIGMPGMNGYEVARELHRRFPDRPAVLVALTGWGQADDLRRAREAGFDHHMVKPADIDALEHLLSSIARASVATSSV